MFESYAMIYRNNSYNEETKYFDMVLADYNWDYNNTMNKKK